MGGWGVWGWEGGRGAGSSELATDRLVGTGGVPASWRHVILIANTLECRCFHQQNHHNTSSQVAAFWTLCWDFVKRCQEVVNQCLNWLLGCVKLEVGWECVSECQTGGATVSASVRQWHPMCQLTPGQNVGQNIDFTICLHRWRFWNCIRLNCLSFYRIIRNSNRNSNQLCLTDL